MEVSFKFNNGETGAQMAQSIAALFGATIAAAALVVTNTGAADGEDTGPETPNPAPPAFDSNGLPWDARIHSDSKAITDKGVWRQRRSVSKELLASVTAELKARAGQPATAPVQAPVAAPIAPAPVAPAALPSLTPPPLQQPPAPPRAFDTLVTFLASHTQTPQNPTGRLTESYIADGLKSWGVVDAAGNGSLQSLAHADDAKVKTVHNAFAQVLGVAGVA